MDELTIRQRQCALDNATDLAASREPEPDTQTILETADVFLAWLNGEDTSTATATVKDTPTPHPFPLVWFDEHRNCGTIYSPDSEAPPCQLPAGHPGSHVSVEGAQRWEWVLATDARQPWTLRRNDGLNFGLCGEPVPGRTPEKNCTRMAGHDGFHSVPNGDGLPPMEWRTKAARETCPATKAAPFGTDTPPVFCNLRTGHAGEHQDGLDTWT